MLQRPIWSLSNFGKVMEQSRNSCFLEGEKVCLRGMVPADLEHYRRWLDSSVATHFLEMGWRPTSDKELEATFESSTNSSDSVVLMIMDKQRDQPVGTTGLYLIHWVCRRAQFRILIGDSSVWNKGLGTDATKLIIQYGFQRLNLETIYLGVNAENLGALRSYEKAGFVVEGRQRRFIYRNGVYYDVVNMSILREEFLNNQKEKV